MLPPLKKYGRTIQGKYVADNVVSLPDYLKDGNEIITGYLPNGVPGEYDFYGGDNLESYIKNKATQPPDWHYHNKKVTYTLNSHGFRTRELDEISWKDVYVLFGCSCAFGVGVSDDETLSHFLSNILNREVINLGIPGGSNQLILDLSMLINEKYEVPYGVIFMWTCTDRMVYYGEQQLENIGSWNLLLTDKYDAKLARFKNLIYNFYYDRSHEIMTFKNIVRANRNVWKNRTRYFEGSFFELVAHDGELTDYFPFGNNARDLLHPGYVDFKRIAEDISEYIYVNNR